MTTYNSATLIATSTNATNQKRNKGVMIVNDGVGVTTTSIFFTTPGGTQGPEVTIHIPQNGAPVIMPIRFYKTGGTQTNCTIYELT
tara:strand:+ start:567 stop:824 length:258 start_codon:yes stop_codon:yes gene_type:complete